MSVPALLTLDRETLINRLDELIIHANGLYVDFNDGERIIGHEAIVHDLEAFALDARTLPIEGSER